MADIDPSSYFTLTDWEGHWPLEERGWIMSPSTAAQMRIFLAMLGILAVRTVCGTGRDSEILEQITVYELDIKH
jgi:hypothetical protein